MSAMKSFAGWGALLKAEALGNDLPCIAHKSFEILCRGRARSRAIRARTSNEDRKGKHPLGRCAKSQGRNENGVETYTLDRTERVPTSLQ